MRTIRTVGHGALEPAELLGLLRRSGIEAIADVRRYPGSRRHPQLARGPMEEWLPEGGVDYAWIPALGGRRTTTPRSPHVALRNEQFRGYADHMATEEFATGMGQLRQLASARSVAVMCAESLWWRCHRRLIADHLVLIGHTAVEHLLHDGRSAPHAPTAGARVESGMLVYDVSEHPLLFDPTACSSLPD